MTPLCTDIDLLHWEPNLLREAAFASQTLLAGTGTLSGTSFTIDSGSLTAAGIHNDQVIVLGGSVNGCFPITSIDSADVLQLSVLYDGLSESDPPVPRAPGASGSLPFTIRTFWPQRTIVTEVLAQAAGVGSSRPGEIPATILNPQSLRRVCALGTMQMIYSAIAAATPDDPHFDVRADLYERLYRRALRNAAVDIDLNGDGKPDAHRLLSVLKFHRT